MRRRTRRRQKNWLLCLLYVYRHDPSNTKHVCFINYIHGLLYGKAREDMSFSLRALQVKPLVLSSSRERARLDRRFSHHGTLFCVITCLLLVFLCMPISSPVCGTNTTAFCYRCLQRLIQGSISTSSNNNWGNNGNETKSLELNVPTSTRTSSIISFVQ